MLPSSLKNEIFGKNKTISVQFHHYNTKDTVDSLTTKQNAEVVVVMVLLGPTSFQRLHVELFNATSWHKFS